MNVIIKFLNAYLNIKIKFDILNFLLRLSVLIALLSIALIIIEKDAFLNSIIKSKILNSIYLIIISSLLYLALKIIIHKNNYFNNSNKQELAKELINYIPSKDRIINAIQIYSNLDLKNPYSDLTIKAINDVEKDLNLIDLEKIKPKISFNSIYTLIIIIIFIISLMKLSNNYYQSVIRLISINKTFEKPLPFDLNIIHDNLTIFKGEEYNVEIEGKGELPKKITLFWEQGEDIYSTKLERTKNLYSYKFNNINAITKLWAKYKNNAIIPYNSYTVKSDTIELKIKIRPKIKKLNINIEPPDYAKINSIQHKNTSININALKGSTIKFEGTVNKKISSALIELNQDSIINMKIENNFIKSEIKALKSSDISLICYDQENNKSIKIKYFINVIDDMGPNIIIDSPKNEIKLDEEYGIQLSGKIADDFGIDKAEIEYYVSKPYYLEQDTTYNNILILKSKLNNTTEYFKYDWDISNLNIGPGDEIIYWIKAYDNNTATGPGIGISKTLKAYFPSLEELFLEVEIEQENIFDTFDNMNESMEDLKNMYDDISNDVLKEQMGWEQEQGTQEIMNELESISNKIENLEEAIEKIEELNEANDLINNNLGEKIKSLQKMFEDIMNPELVEAIKKLQESLNKNNFKQSIEELKNFEFEMDDLEKQLDRMIDLFEKVVAEQKLDELIKKIENMENFQKEILHEIKSNETEANIQVMENSQIINLNNMLKTMEEAESIIEKINKKTSDSLNELRNSSLSKNIQDQINQMPNLNKINKEKISSTTQSNLNNMKNKIDKIISDYNEKELIQILIMYTRIIKNLLDMSYEQEMINNESKIIKYKNDLNIKNIAKKENMILNQYKNLFLQIAELSNKSFHMKPSLSKTFGQIFNNLLKTISSFEKGEINLAKKHQTLTLEYLNKSVILLLEAMDDMQSNSAYSEYLEAMQELTEGQQSVNQGMQSLLPMPFGQQPGENDFIQSLIEQQTQLMQQLKELMQQNGMNPGMGKAGEEGELGKAIDEMEDIINNLKNNMMNQETFDRGKKVYNKLLNHQKAKKEKGMDKLWEMENFKREELSENNQIKQQNKNSDIQELYQTLNELNQNKNITLENKVIIEEYLKILINEKINNQTND